MICVIRTGNKAHKTTRRNALKTLGITGLAVSSLSGFTNTVAAKSAGHHVPKGLAKKAVEKQVLAVSQQPEFSDWKNADIGSEVTFEMKNASKGPKYLRSAYVFPISTNDEGIGYVTVSPRRSWPPILEYSTAAVPNTLIEGAIQAGEELGKTATGNVLYYGGVKYGLEFDDGTAMNLRNGWVQDAGEGTSSTSLAYDSDKAAQQWETIENTPSTTTDGIVASGSTSSDGVTTTALPYPDDLVYIREVPAWTEHDAGDAEDTHIGPGPDSYDRWDGCTPVAGSMVIAYHEGVSEDNDFAREVIIDRLHEDMETSENGLTLPLDIDNGFDSYDYVTLCSKSYNGSNIYAWSPPEFVIDEISRHNRPFLLNMTSGNTAEDRTQPYGNHSVTVAGYRYGGDQFILHDTWDSEPHYLTYGGWFASMYTKVTAQ